jgi:hypothetical protein
MRPLRLRVFVVQLFSKTSGMHPRACDLLTCPCVTMTVLCERQPTPWAFGLTAWLAIRVVSTLQELLLLRDECCCAMNLRGGLPIAFNNCLRSNRTQTICTLLQQTCKILSKPRPDSCLSTIHPCLQPVRLLCWLGPHLLCGNDSSQALQDKASKQWQLWWYLCSPTR